MCRCGCFQGEHGIRRTQGVRVVLADGGGVGGGCCCKDVL